MALLAYGALGIEGILKNFLTIIYGVYGKFCLRIDTELNFFPELKFLSVLVMLASEGPQERSEKFFILSNAALSFTLGSVSTSIFSPKIQNVGFTTLC